MGIPSFVVYQDGKEIGRLVIRTVKLKMKWKTFYDHLTNRGE